MFKGRLGLETARIPQGDRHGVMWLGRGRLTVEDGCLLFTTVGQGELEAGSYQIPFQNLSCLLFGPGTTISHDAMRIMYRQGTGAVFTGEDGVRLYSSMPHGPHHAKMARRHATLWADPEQKNLIARRLFQRRFGDAELPPQQDLDSLRGIEGKRARAVYKLLAVRHKIDWQGRNYDRQNPEQTDPLNQAINHSSTAYKAAAQVAIAISGALPELGFIHEDASISFALDIVDLYRDTHVLPTAFEAFKQAQAQAPSDQAPDKLKVERLTRQLSGKRIKADNLVAKMIDDIKELLCADDDPRDP